jgi:NAD(P)-dependent dehydrogenase (short-subunit alcohol dehydrogenase family)
VLLLQVVETGDPESIQTWRSYYDLHVHSVNALNAAFFKLFPTVSKVIVNITSLAAVVPVPGWSMYCSARAAREAIFRSIAAEEDGGGVTVLSYSPGPVETDMLDQVRSESLPVTKEMITGWTVLTAEQTVAKLTEVLEKGLFENGGRVDYFDV